MVGADVPASVALAGGQLCGSWRVGAQHLGRSRARAVGCVWTEVSPCGTERKAGSAAPAPRFARKERGTANRVEVLNGQHPARRTVRSHESGSLLMSNEVMGVRRRRGLSREEVLFQDRRMGLLRFFNDVRLPISSLLS